MTETEQAIQQLEIINKLLKEYVEAMSETIDDVKKILEITIENENKIWKN